MPKLSFGISAEKDWKIIFSSALILIVLTILISIFFYLKIDKKEIFSIDNAGGNEIKLDISLLRDTVSYYQSKALTFEEINREDVSVVDPSL